ncbi:MAG TPA: hypothetical protein VGD66_04335 [Allosphingosinicella sp.]|jgi:hypothetical protein
MPATLVQLLPDSPTLWSCFAAAAIALSAPIGWIFSARYKYRAGTIDAGTRQRTALREQDRLDRALEVEAQFLTQLTRRMQSEVDGQLTAVPGSQPAPAQVEKKAA